MFLLAVNGRLSERPGVALKVQCFLRQLSLSATATEQHGYKYLYGGRAVVSLGVPRQTNMLGNHLAPPPSVSRKLKQGAVKSVLSFRRVRAARPVEKPSEKWNGS